MKKLTLGVIGTSKKEDEKRVPIHPDHLSRLPEDIRKQLIFESRLFEFILPFYFELSSHPNQSTFIYIIIFIKIRITSSNDIYLVI